MKTFLFVLFSFALLARGFSQTAALPDSILFKTSGDPKIVIRCGGTFNGKKTPLFIVDGVPMAGNSSFLLNMNPKNIKSIQVLKEPVDFGCFGSASENGVVLISTKEENQTPLIQKKEHPFKVHKICNTNWTTPQDVYNAIQANVPNVQMNTTANMSNTLNIRMRGDDNTVVLVDGIRYNASILNALNPADIEKIEVAPSVAAINYLLNN